MPRLVKARHIRGGSLLEFSARVIAGPDELSRMPPKSVQQLKTKTFNLPAKYKNRAHTVKNPTGGMEGVDILSGESIAVFENCNGVN